MDRVVAFWKMKIEMWAEAKLGRAGLWKHPRSGAGKIW